MGQAGRQKKADRRRQAREMGRQEKQTGGGGKWSRRRWQGGAIDRQKKLKDKRNS